ncbi:MAG: hypothetical protein IJG32_09120 [Selenomonadaceae bacterium]|nr:hypothetical protein [Selenomonadaceae bacterium]MBQ4403012.1 hypothetical protein [Selenomonadaceae bacterium]
MEKTSPLLANKNFLYATEFFSGQRDVASSGYSLKHSIILITHKIF